MNQFSVTYLLRRACYAGLNRKVPIVNKFQAQLRPLSQCALPLLALMLLGGCSFFHRNADKVDYQRSTQSRPLEVPPDLDSPDTGTALNIPDASGPSIGQRRDDGTLVLGTPASAGTSSTSPPGMAAGPSDSGGDLRIADSADSAWRRVGLALERSGAVTVLSRDEAARSYEIQASGITSQKPSWFKRAITLGRAGNTTSNTAAVRLSIRVTEDGSRSTIHVEGPASDAGDSAARNVRSILKQRLS